MAAKIPFKIDKMRPRALVQQMTDGLRDAIITGYYKPGDMLPTIHEWTRMYDVSIRVPEGALANLVKEGYVVTRPRQGCMVLPQNGRRTWRGHVLFVRPVDNNCHFVSEEIFAAEESLSRAGYLVTIVVVRKKADDDFDLHPLEKELKRNVTLAVVFGNMPQILGCLARADVPFTYMDVCTVRDPVKGCVGRCGAPMDAAVDEFVAHCVRVGVRHVAVVDKRLSGAPAASRLEAAGIRVSRIEVEAEFGPERVENLERETCRALDSLFARRGRKWLPDVIYVEDNYQATGALFSLLAHGVKMPDDVGFVTVKNHGHGPALPISLTCLEFNPSAAGSEVGRAVAGFLDSGKFAYDGASAFRYIVGETFPDVKPPTTKRRRKS